MHALKMPRKTEEERELRAQEMQKGIVHAIQVPLSVMDAINKCWPFLLEVARHCNISCASDIQVGINCKFVSTIWLPHLFVSCNTIIKLIWESRMHICRGAWNHWPVFYVKWDWVYVLRGRLQDASCFRWLMVGHSHYELFAQSVDVLMVGSFKIPSLFKLQNSIAVCGLEIRRITLLTGMRFHPTPNLGFSGHTARFGCIRFSQTLLIIGLILNT